MVPLVKPIRTTVRIYKVALFQFPKLVQEMHAVLQNPIH
jgi:hypothetical protein